MYNHAISRQEKIANNAGLSYHRRADKQHHGDLAQHENAQDEHGRKGEDETGQQLAIENQILLRENEALQRRKGW